MFYAKFGWSCRIYFWEDDFQISSMFFRYFFIIYPLEEVGALHLNKLEFSLPKDALW